MKVKISIEEIKQITERKRFINSLNLDDIIWTEDGVELDISEKIKDDFWFMGLTNFDFITTNYYKSNT